MLRVNPAVKAFIISESFLWPAWNLTAPILAIFVATKLPLGNVETVGFSYSLHLIMRVIFELISGKLLSNSGTAKKIYVIIGGISLVSITYACMAFANSVTHLYLAMGLTGLCFGIISPAKNSLFSTHLDKHKETMEWGLTDAVVFIAIAIATAVGGLIASKYGFSALFILSAWVNMFAILPYVMLLHDKKGMNT